MRILMINSVCGIRSTGRICTDLATTLMAQGNEVKIAYGRANVPEQFHKFAVRIGSDWDVKISVIHTRLTDKHGFANVAATKKFLKWADQYDPDLLWLHNIHGYYINIELLFEWIKKRPEMQVKWTLHDCWAFTGHCSHFTAVRCDQWKNQCLHCVQRGTYPASYIRDNCSRNFERKKELFTGIKSMTLITPSNWLANLVKQSFLKEYPVEVKYNTVNTDIFKPTPSDLRERYKLIDKKIVLGVASVWSARKGLNDFICMSSRLKDDYQIVLIGVTKKQIRKLPENIIGIERTDSARELAQWYTVADVFVNPTREDNFPTVNIEALACGTPVVTFETGGSPESLDETCGSVVEYGNVEKLEYEIARICRETPYSVENCVKRAETY